MFQFLTSKKPLFVSDRLIAKSYLNSPTPLAPVTLKQSIVWLSACWQWGIEQEIVESDPWKSFIKRVKIPPKQMPKPFTSEEIKAII